MKKIFLGIIPVLLVLIFSSCGKDEVKVPKNGELLMKYTWKLQPNETLNAATDSLKKQTGVIADVQLNGDVEDIANFFAETLSFSRDKNDKSKLAYSSQIGEGLLSSKVVGYWEISKNGDTLTLKEWDNQLGTTKDPVVYIIQEISDKKLVLKNNSTGGIKIYFPK